MAGHRMQGLRRAPVASSQAKVTPGDRLHGLLLLLLTGQLDLIHMGRVLAGRRALDKGGGDGGGGGGSGIEPSPAPRTDSSNVFKLNNLN